MDKNNFPQIKMTKNTKSFGTAPNGQEAFLFTLSNNHGCEFSVTNYGAAVSSLKIKNTHGKQVDVVLGFDSLEHYIRSFDLPSPPYFGAAVGRFAGRINQGQFILNGKQIFLSKNNGNNHLHGGNMGFSRVFWEVKALNYNDNPSITLAYTSVDNEDEFPGELYVEVTYTLTENNEFRVLFYAKSSADTIVNLTHHGYFNLSGHGNSITNQKLTVNAKKILETSDELIPTGTFTNLENHPFNFRNQQDCPVEIDNTFVLEDEKAVSLSCKETNLKMTVFTNQPAVHIYVGGNCFDQIKGKENTDYHSKSGICFETQNFPDAPNHPHFPTAILKKGAIYSNDTIFKFENLDGGGITNRAKDLMALSTRIPYSGR